MRPRVFALACRTLYSTTRRDTAQPLLDLLRANPELGDDDARNELRWMRQACSSRPDTKLEQMVQRRADGEPLQYVLGDTDFGPLTLLTRAPVLIPRPETAFIVEELASRLSAAPRPLRVLDLCTGSGCIPLLLSHLMGDRLEAAFGVDVNPAAVALAHDNIESIRDTRVRVLEADILAPNFVDKLKEATDGISFDIITANPPYIPQDEWERLPRSVRDYEDPRALVGGPVEDLADGVAFYAHIARLAEKILRPDSSLNGIPRIAVEIGADQAHAVSRLLDGSEVVQDQYGRDRMILAGVHRSLS